MVCNLLKNRELPLQDYFRTFADEGGGVSEIQTLLQAG